MTVRTSRRTVTFARPFFVPGIDAEQPPGSYVVETDEELLEDLSFPAYRRIATLIFLPAHAQSGGLAHVMRIDPHALARAEEKDGGAAARRPQ